jgi:hypothetical protein
MSRGQTLAASTLTIDAINAAIESGVTNVLTKVMPSLFKQAFKTPCAPCRTRAVTVCPGGFSVFGNRKIAELRSARAGISSRV